MAVIDVICVTKYDMGPYFAIRTTTYNDGGSQVFYGIGYKVIKYHKVQGRRDTELGFWTMPYSIEPTNISVLDLAIQFRNQPEVTAKKYVGKFMRITGTISRIKDYEIILSFQDPDGAYTLKVKCAMAENNKFSDLNKGSEVTVIGTIEQFTLATENSTNMIIMSNCFV